MLFACRGRHEEVPVAMRPREIPVPIPNTMVKPRAADGTTPWGVGEQVAAGAPSKKGLEPKERQDSGAQEGGVPERRHGPAGGGVVRAHPSPSAAGAASCTLKTEY